MKTLHGTELFVVSAGCSACQHRAISVTAGSFAGTLSAMAVAAGTIMLGATAPVAAACTLVTFAGIGYYTFDYFQHSAGIQVV